MKKIKKRVITILLIVLALFIIWAGTLCVYLHIWILAAEPYVVTKNVKTPFVLSIQEVLLAFGLPKLVLRCRIIMNSL